MDTILPPEGITISLPIVPAPPINADTLYNSGCDLLHGNNRVKINPEEGVRRIVEAANTKRHVLAAGHHALLLYRGRIIPQDIDACKKLCNLELVRNGLVWSANSGHPIAQTLVGRLGEIGFDLSNVEVFNHTKKSWWPRGKKAAAILELYRLAAEQGYSPAEEKIARSYVDADPDLAAKYLTRAAEKGLATAQYSLHLLCADGDLVASRNWLAKSASQEYRPAVSALLATLEG